MSTSTDDDADGGEPGTSPVVVRLMLAAMRAIGLDTDAICAAAGVSQAALAARTDPMLIEEVVPLWRAAGKQVGRGTLGLPGGAAMPHETLVEYLAGNSPHVRAALGQMARSIG